MFLLGSSELADQHMVQIDPADGSTKSHPLTRIGDSGYRVTQVETIPDGDRWRYFMIWPEMNGAGDDFGFVVDHLVYPVAAHASKRGLQRSRSVR